MAPRIAILATLVALALSNVLVGHTTALHQDAGAQAVSTPLPGKRQWVGAGGCASVGCHNANGLQGELGSEYTTWILHDPHARAYEVLFSARSRSMVANLFPEGGKKASELALCLDCHVHPGYATANHHPRFAKEDGVSCESCHGAAGDWISEHYKGGLTEKQKSDMGMGDTRSLVGRIRSCTPCHVGAPGLEVNHDLIAAGHPRLAFEFSAFHALLPHHWQDAKDKNLGASPRARPDWDAAAWFVGQAVTSQAALELLAARAAGKIWPEFAETDCYACHHQLEKQSWRQNPEHDRGNRKPGSMPWSEWYVSPLPYQGPGVQAFSKSVLSEIDRLREGMQNSGAPDTKVAVGKQAAEASAALERWIQQAVAAKYPSDILPGILRKFADDGAKNEARSWDDAAQRYLAIAALHYALRDARGPQGLPEVKDALKRIRDQLQFPPDRDSPSPGYTPTSLLDSYGALRKKLGS